MAIIWLSHGVEEWAAEWHQDENVAGKPFGFGTVTLATLVISDANLEDQRRLESMSGPSLEKHDSSYLEDHPRKEPLVGVHMYLTRACTGELHVLPPRWRNAPQQTVPVSSWWKTTLDGRVSLHLRGRTPEMWKAL